MKYILIIGDGMADNPVPTLDNKTPLQHANIPVMDALAAKGEVGNVINCPDGLPAGSDTAILSIFGADPNVCYTGRSPLEAAATGIQLQPGDVSYRCNMIALEDSDLPFEEKKILSHSGGSIEGDQSIQLVTDLFNDPEFQAAAQKAGMVVHPAASFRHIAVQSGANIVGIKLIPPHDHLGEVIGPLLPSGNDNAEVLKDLMKLAHKVLDHHPINEKRRAEGKLPANGIWLRDLRRAPVLRHRPPVRPGHPRGRGRHRRAGDQLRGQSCRRPGRAAQWQGFRRRPRGGPRRVHPQRRPAR